MTKRNSNHKELKHLGGKERLEINVNVTRGMISTGRKDDWNGFCFASPFSGCNFLVQGCHGHVYLE